MTNPNRVPIYFWAGLAVLGAAGAFWYFAPNFTLSKPDTQVEAGSSKPTGKTVRVETVEAAREKLLRVSESSPAEVWPFEQTDIYAKIPGYVQEIYVDIGDVVHPPGKDDKDPQKMIKEKKILAQLYVPEMFAEREQKQTQVDQAITGFGVAKAHVATAAAQVQEAIAGLTRAEGNYKRWQLENDRIADLVKRKIIDEQTGAETWNQFQSALSALKEAEAKVQLAKANQKESEAKQAEADAYVRVARANLKYVNTMLQYANVVAPYEAVVTKLNLYRGAFLLPKNNEQPIFTVARTDKLRIVVDIPEKDVGFLNQDPKKPNNLVRIKLDALPDLPAKDKWFEWPITKFAPVLGGGHKVRAEIHVDNPGGKLFPGMYGHATVILEEKPKALTIPAGCLGTAGKENFVYKVVDGKAQRQVVTIGIHDGKKVEITSGLKEKEEIIQAGKDTIRDGQAVLAKKAPPSAK